MPGPAGGPSVLLDVPASSAQRRLWAVERQAAGAALHNINVQVTWQEPILPEALAAALTDLAARHETLRTSFRVDGGTLRQQIHPAAGVPVAVEFADLGGLPPAEADQRFRQARDRAAATPFDLATAPLLRLLWARRPQQDGAVHDTLVIIVHHIVADASSAHILVRDLAEAYRARAAGRAPGWAPVEVQYADYSAWLADQASSPQLAGDLAYWREHLADLTELDLSYGRPRPAEPPHSGRSVPVEIGETLASQIGALARAEHATPFMVLLAAYAWAVGRVFGAVDVPIGASISTRVLPELSRAVGLFVDRTVFRCDLTGRPTMTGLIRRLREEVLAAQEHGQAGFDRIVEAAAPPRRYGVEPLAQVSINLQPPVDTGPPGSGNGQFGNGTVRHDLALDLADQVTSYTGTLEFRDGVVPAEAAQRVAAVFSQALEAAVADPALPLPALAAVGAAERARLHAAQDGGPALDGGAGDFLELVGRWVDSTPDAVAVDAPDGRLTYRELAAHAGAVASELRRRGVSEGEPVLVPLPRCALLPAALLGVLAAGAAYVPADPSAPPAYLETIARAVPARFAVTSPDRRDLLPASLTAVTAAPEAGPADGAWPGPRVHPATAAYVLFTSGSTGAPKGVVVERRNLLAYAGALTGLLSPAPGAAHLLVQAPTFDSSLGTIAGALASGGTLRLVSEDAAVDPALLADLLAEAPADYLKITPSHLSALLGSVPDQVLRPRRGLILGGEGAHHDLVRRLATAGWTVYGHYGPTEATIGVLAHRLGEQSAAPSQTVPLGRPLPGARVYLLDEHGAPVPPGCVGELHIGGALVARGYAGLSGATAAAFVPDPFAVEPGARMYRTGDLGRRLPDETFEFCGRRDRQIKVRGRRMEPAEVEAALTALPGVSQAAVVLHPGAGTGRLVGYVVAVPGHPLNAGRLKEDLAGTLPAHLLPDAVVVMERLPLRPSGKLDLKALPQPQAEEGGGEDFADPVTREELILAEVWRSVLRMDRVSVTARFFDAGGDSITAIDVVSQARARGLRLSARDLFEHQTIRSLAAVAAGGEPLPVRAARAGLGGAATAVVIRMTAADPDAARARLAGPAASRGWACDGGVQVSWLEAEAEVTADPVRCDDRSAAQIVAALAGPDAAGPPAPPSGPAAGLPPGAGQAAVGPQAAAALADPAGAGAAVHDTYGTTPLDLAAAAVFGVLAADPAAPDGERAVVLADCGVAAAAPLGQHAVPGLARLPASAACPRPEPGDLLPAVKAAVRDARAGAEIWAESALAGQAVVPPVTLRLLPLPLGAWLAGAGVAGLADGGVAAVENGRVAGLADGGVAGLDGAAQRTVVLLTGTQVLALPAGAGGLAAGCAAFAERVAAELDRLAGHCLAHGPVYRPDDFPDAGLDEQSLARLLDEIGGRE